MKTFRGVLLLLCMMTCFSVMAQESSARQAAVVSHVEWSAGSNQILVTLREGGIYIIDPVTQLVIVNISGDQTGPIEDASLQANGSRIATVDRTTGLDIWDIHTDSLVYTEHDLAFAWQVDWSPSGQWLITGNMNEMFIRDAAGLPLFSVSYAIDDIPVVAFSPDGQFLALGFTYSLEIYDLTQRHSLTSNIVPGFRHSIQWSANGNVILAAITDATREGNFYRAATIDPFTGERFRTYSGFPNELTYARWSPDEKQILATSVDGTAYLVDADSGVITPIFTGDVPLLSADWSPYGGQIAIGAPLSSETSQATDGDNAALPIQLLVPDPTLERLQAIAALCDAPLTVTDAIPQVEQPAALTDFVAQVTALPEGTIPPACAADLIAVAEAISAGQ